MTTGSPWGFAVVGADHLHLFSLVDGLVRAGAVAVAHVGEGGLLAPYERWRPDSQRRDLAGILDDDAIRLVVTAGIPSERAAVALAALGAGKAVLSDKPGVTSRAQLEAVTAALDGRAGRPWTVLFSERFENRAVSAAIERARGGEVGRVVHVIGTGPHSLHAEQRPAWFWDPAATGGILVDIGAHQVDQFLAVTGTDDADRVTVLGAMVGNVSCPDHASMQDIGSMTLGAGGVVGDHRVDYLSPAGLDAWGDVRLTIVGTTGTLEARANVDVTGHPGGEHLIHVDGAGTRRLDVRDEPLTWAHDLVADLADDGERLMTQRHVLAVCAVTLDAQERAGRWGGGTTGGARP